MNKMKRTRLRQLASVLILALTIMAFIYYFAHNPEVADQLSRTSPAVISLLLFLYLIFTASLGLITYVTVKLCYVKLPKSESMLLSAYSSVINFFGPLQSGPAFRAAYLKLKHNVALKNYTAATLCYYFFYGVFSGLMLVSGVLKGWLVLVIGVVLLGAYIIWRIPQLSDRLKALNLNNLFYLALATMLQVVIFTLIFYVELKNVAPGTSFSQAVIYTGAANLALFVSLTPGAVGFRESFLLFSQNLHQVSSDTIVAANILDRAIYIVLILILAVFIFGTHANRRFKQL
jgi:uncharacterized membrane protein YbhN (UPF0104 family)